MGGRANTYGTGMCIMKGIKGMNQSIRCRSYNIILSRGGQGSLRTVTW